MKHFLETLKAAEAPELGQFKLKVKELREMETASSLGGSRNENLNIAAFIGGTLVAAGHAEEFYIIEELQDASTANGYVDDYGDSETQRVIDAGITAGMEAAPKVEHANPFYDLVITADQLGTLTPATWLIDELLMENSLTFLVGDPGVGKSFMTFDLAASIAKKTSWHGRPISSALKTVYISGEGNSGWNYRRLAWEKYHRTSVGDSIHFVPGGVTLDSPVLRHFIEYVEDIRPGLIVLDTLSRTCGDWDENSSSDMSKYVQACDRLREASGGAVLVLHHPNKGNGTIRGSSVLNGAADTTMYLTKEDDHRDDAPRTLWVSKNKEGRDGDFGNFRLKSMVVGTKPTGEDRRSAVFITQDGATPWDRGENNLCAAAL